MYFVANDVCPPTTFRSDLSLYMDTESHVTCVMHSQLFHIMLRLIANMIADARYRSSSTLFRMHSSPRAEDSRWLARLGYLCVKIPPHQPIKGVLPRPPSKTVNEDSTTRFAMQNSYAKKKKKKRKKDMQRPCVKYFVMNMSQMMYSVVDRRCPSSAVVPSQSRDLVRRAPSPDSRERARAVRGFF